MHMLMGLALAAAILAAPALAQNPAPANPPNRDRAFARADADKDGKLSLAEFQGAAKKADPAKREKRFKKVDTNNDGFLSKEEFIAGIGSPRKK